MDMHVPLQVAPERVQRREKHPKGWIRVQLFGCSSVCGLGAFSSARFSLNTSPSAEGIVSLMCCQRVCGGLAVCVAIHWSVAFLPHVGQNRLLQLKHTFLRCGQAPFEQQWLA
ncbi:hypothetical protein HDG40_007361 [Paraburkholderia sp. JPY158]|uniref:Uncharacterized protein n=1 Tax=Paraburkholderia atlantica TaxID=2654982 RepID=A0A7W8QFQ9_PARAM|nr:hypothetical protein [Paraburkholderia atlantica]MBB5429164.1 hypothetical protein [Paraburkholderia atlantica]